MSDTNLVMTQPVQRVDQAFLEKHEFIIPLALFLIFIAFTLPGISWGAPNIWHPDEIVYIAIRSLHENVDFDSSNFNHPHLPIYAMLGLGKLLLAFGQTDREVLKLLKGCVPSIFSGNKPSSMKPFFALFRKIW